MGICILDTCNIIIVYRGTGTDYIEYSVSCIARRTYEKERLPSIQRLRRLHFLRRIFYFYFLPFASFLLLLFVLLSSPFIQILFTVFHFYIPNQRTEIRFMYVVRILTYIRIYSSCTEVPSSFCFAYSFIYFCCFSRIYIYTT